MNFTKELRDLKLRQLDGSFNLSANEEFIKKNKDKFIFLIENFKDDIVSGSFALSLYDLMNRSINDIDIAVKESRYDKYYIGEYDDHIPNRLGIVGFKHRVGLFSYETYNVDFFIQSPDIEYHTFLYKGVLLKIHNPIQIITHKIELASNSTKHKRDVENIFYKINEKLEILE